MMKVEKEKVVELEMNMEVEDRSRDGEDSEAGGA